MPKLTQVAIAAAVRAKLVANGSINEKEPMPTLSRHKPPKAVSQLNAILARRKMMGGV